MSASLGRSGSRTTRIPRAARIVASLLIVLALAACSTKTAAQLATEALNAGLQSHVAGDLDKATGHYQECLKQEATNKLCLYNLGLVAQTQGKAAEAESNYRLALASDPDYAPALFNLAILRTQAGATDEAIILYLKFITILPDDAAGHLNLGLLFRAIGDEKAGNEEIALALQLDPTLAAPASSPQTPLEASPSP